MGSASSGSEDSLAAHLSQMAKGQAPPNGSQMPTRPNADVVEDESGSLAGELMQAVHASNASGMSRPNRRPQPMDRSLKVAAAVLVIVVGLLLLPPAVWAVMLMFDFDVPMAHRDNAAFMARLMLVCWPIALSLLGCGSAMLWQLRSKRRTETAD
jgi:hypothetical protein